jgi:1,2-phenylacetyl-CoA epoxidase catalytic subunit
MRSATLPRPFHQAVLRWRDTYLTDYDFLLESWDRYFPTDRRFELCAFRELGMCDEIECGEWKGKPKATRAAALHSDQAGHLLGAIKAQASTEFGSIQQHREVLARAQEEEEQVWILRMMAEELRHGYQMLHLLLEDDWSAVSKETGAEMVEEILSMTTGSHVLGAFNIAFDSFVDSAVFCALIDRVGKYQLEMQRISAYKPMAESMPQMLREEAFHLAAGVVPLRRWVQKAAAGEIYITMEVLQRAINKWLPRGLEMFGDERGGGTNVRWGLKPMKNGEAQGLYYEEVKKLLADLNLRYVRARCPELAVEEAEALLARLMEGGGSERGIDREDLLRAPAPAFFRRRGLPAFTLVGRDGETFADIEAHAQHLRRNLPEAYLAGRDFRDHLETLRRVQAGELTAEEASRQMPALKRVGGTCPCSRAVRWVVDEPAVAAPSAAPA